MTETIQVKLTNQVCPLGTLYAQKHSTTPPKAAVTSCEGMCLRGEIARRAANLIAHQLAPEKAVRICHGGFLETGGGMKELVQRADQVLVLDGCFMACGTRLTKGAFPELKPDVVITDKLFEFDRNLFGVDEMPEAEIQAHAQVVANKVVEEYL
ncbi:MAG: putative zinc-binding protein [Nitrospiria bacterium]